MMKKRASIKLLASAADREKLEGILQQLRAKGIRVSDAGSSLRKNDIVLAVLSDHFYGDEELRARLFQQLAVGADAILPLNLGEAPVPEDIMNLLFARNIITVAGRDDALVAERILSAIPERKNTMPVILSVAAAVLLLLGGIFLWKSLQREEPEPEVQVDEPVAYPWGITEEDLAKIQEVLIVGDRFAYYAMDDLDGAGYWPEIYDFAYETWEDDGRHWYSTEDGHEYTLTKYDDLRFLELMPNLNRLRMVLVDVESDMLPDLSGYTNLNYVTLQDCSIDNVEWIAGKSLATVDIIGTPVKDYSPLTQCTYLRYAYIDGFGKSKGDVSGFAPPALQELYISNLQPGAVDLSGLAGCTRLNRLSLDSLQITDLDFLEGLTSLGSLQMYNLHELRDISAVSGITYLRELRLQGCDQVTDYTPISSCLMLEDLTIDRWNWIPVDSAFLNDLPRLKNIGLFGLNLNNMDFLGTLNDMYGINLAFCGDIQDYSGLKEVRRYQWLHINPRSDGGPFGDFSLVAPYLQESIIDAMELYNCTNVELANLPKINSRLVINRGDLEDLTGLNSESINHLELRDMQYLRTLDGIEGLKKLQNNIMQLSIYGCPRLTDLEALNGADLHILNLIGTYTMPDFSQLNINTLCLESIEDLEDLSCLEGMNKDKNYQFQFPGLDNLKDLSVLRNFRGVNLCVPPQVAEQAQELVDAGNFRYYEVCYPQSGWNPMDQEVTLLSLEELETLPKPVLRRVSRVWIAGNEVIDPNQYEIWDEWTDHGPVPALHDRETGETTRLEMGSITDFSMLSDLTGVWELRLFNQPLTNLEGIQYFTNLACFEARYCNDLTDVSALYTLQSLEDISFSNTEIDSIQGVQNLPRLRALNINFTRVTDVSPLAEVDYAVAVESGGFNLSAENGHNIEDFSCLSAVPSFSYLGLYSYPAESWMEYVEQASIRNIGCQLGSDERLKRFVEQHPELEQMYIEAGHQLTDLTPLLELDHLNYLNIWDGDEVARRSLEGHERRFYLENG